MDKADLTFLADMLRRRSGLVLTPKQAPQIESRLAPVMRRFGFRDIDSLLRELRHGHDALARSVTEAMTTNESSFFRDRAVFDIFSAKILPALCLQRAASKRLRIWCAACASGQEPYSLAMILNDRRLAEQGWAIDLIATDLNPEMIARSEDGLYSQFEVQRGLPIRRLVTHFTQEAGGWRVNESLRRMVKFRQFNLLDSFGWLDELDVVFCRNVLMYFDQKTKTGVLDKIAEALAPDGTLVLGPTETIQGLGTAFVQTQDAGGFYAKARTALPLRSAVG
jgi:chemotaxis protein methyltransferase CheR